jgi:hypothetical protein
MLFILKYFALVMTASLSMAEGSPPRELTLDLGYYAITTTPRPGEIALSSLNPEHSALYEQIKTEDSCFRDFANSQSYFHTLFREALVSGSLINRIKMQISSKVSPRDYSFGFLDEKERDFVDAAILQILQTVRSVRLEYRVGISNYPSSAPYFERTIEVILEDINVRQRSIHPSLFGRYNGFNQPCVIHGGGDNFAFNTLVDLISGEAEKQLLTALEEAFRRYCNSNSATAPCSTRARYIQR